MSSEFYNFKPIGILHSCFPDLFGTPRQGCLAPTSRGFVELAPELRHRGFLDGLNEFSYVWLVFVFHRNTNKRVAGRVHPPRLSGERIGCFASRSPHRPNPIGLSRCRVASVTDNRLDLAEVDLVDGTPILDIKPYVLEYDSAPHSQSGWTDRLPLQEIEVSFSDVFQQKAKATQLPVSTIELIRDCLKLDPRPLVYRDMDYRCHVMAIECWDVEFYYDGKRFIVSDLRAQMKAKKSATGPINSPT